MSIPVVISGNGLGVPVRPVSKGAPSMVVSSIKSGHPIVISDKGAPFIVDGLDIEPDDVTHMGVTVTHNGEAVTYGGDNA